MTENPAERRKAPRVATDLPATIDTSAGRQKAKVRDLSTKGVCFFMDSPIPEMTAVKIDLDLPFNGKNEAVTGDGAVVRCRRIASGVEHYEVAVFFTYLTETGKNVLDRYVKVAAS